MSAVPNPPSYQVYRVRFSTDDDGRAYWDPEIVICYLCANRTKDEFRDYSVLGLDFSCCESCEIKVHQLIVDFFGKDRIQEVKSVNASHVLYSRNVNWLIEADEKRQKELELFIEINEYIDFSNAVKALCIWHKPEVKL